MMTTASSMAPATNGGSAIRISTATISALEGMLTYLQIRAKGLLGIVPILAITLVQILPQISKFTTTMDIHVNNRQKMGR